VTSFYFIPILLVPSGRFSLCYTSIKSISAFQYDISILIVGCVISRFVSSGIRATLRNKVISFSYFCFFSVPLSFSVFASFIFLFLVCFLCLWHLSKKKKRNFILLMSLIISIAYIKKKRLDKKTTHSEPYANRLKINWNFISCLLGVRSHHIKLGLIFISFAWDFNWRFNSPTEI